MDNIVCIIISTYRRIFRTTWRVGRYGVSSKHQISSVFTRPLQPCYYLLLLLLLLILLLYTIRRPAASAAGKVRGRQR